MIQKSLSFLLALFIAGCSAPAAKSCLNSPYKYEFPITTPGGIAPSQSQNIQPVAGWNFVTSIPDPKDMIILFLTDQQIWLGNSTVLQVYDMQTNKWNTIPAGISVIPEIVLSDSDGFWGVGMADNHSRIQISKYDREKSTFSEIPSISDLLVDHRFASTKSIEISKENTLWMNLQDLNSLQCALYRIDTSRAQFQKYDLVDWQCSSDFEIASNGSVWYYGNGNLQWFNPQESLSGEVDLVGIEPDKSGSPTYTSVNNLFIDRLNRLWVDDRGFLDISNPANPVWHLVIRSKEFITDNGSTEYAVTWDRPYSIYQSSNQDYWFTDHAGVVRLNPSDGSWCRVSSYPSPVVEDQAGNLWLVSNGELYQHAK